jgi:hypothetical protein
MAADRESSGWVKMEISLGHIATVVVMLVSLTAWAVVAAGRADQAGKDLQDLQQKVSSDAKELKAAMVERFNGVDKRLDGIDTRTVIIPTQQDRVERLIKLYDEAMTRIGAQDQRTGALEQRLIEQATRLDGVLHPNVPAVRITR